MPTWRLCLHNDDERERSILVEGSATAPVAELLRKLGDLGVTRPSIDGRPGTDVGRRETIGSIGLRNGSVVSEPWSRSGAAFGSTRHEHADDWWLVAVTGPCAGATSHLRPGRHVIGRGTDADVVLADPRVSGNHAAISINTDPSGAAAIEDLHSSNGTRVDGHPLDLGRHPVTAGSHLLIRATVLELVHLRAAELGPPDFFTGRCPVRRSFAHHRSGLVLCPISPLDGSPIGAGRIDESLRTNPRPGRGLLSLSGQCFEVQILESGGDRPYDGQTIGRPVTHRTQ